MFVDFDADGEVWWWVMTLSVETIISNSLSTATGEGVEESGLWMIISISSTSVGLSGDNTHSVPVVELVLLTLIFSHERAVLICAVSLILESISHLRGLTYDDITQSKGITCLEEFWHSRSGGGVIVSKAMDWYRGRGLESEEAVCVGEGERTQYDLRGHTLQSRFCQRGRGRSETVESRLVEILGVAASSRVSEGNVLYGMYIVVLSLDGVAEYETHLSLVFDHFVVDLSVLGGGQLMAVGNTYRYFYLAQHTIDERVRRYMDTGESRARVDESAVDFRGGAERLYLDEKPDITGENGRSIEQEWRNLIPYCGERIVRSDLDVLEVYKGNRRFSILYETQDDNISETREVMGEHRRHKRRTEGSVDDDGRDGRRDKTLTRTPREGSVVDGAYIWDESGRCCSAIEVVWVIERVGRIKVTLLDEAFLSSVLHLKTGVRGGSAGTKRRGIERVERRQSESVSYEYYYVGKVRRRQMARSGRLWV
ncbi:hypothetical protein Tco_0657528 [Tanacetum coccineum]|uniref:Uncharacterized protein n=1 Tax=Tanacetum coccineum TaxID=301880 RepID=A0ABQ4XC07_9ASTR